MAGLVPPIHDFLVCSTQDVDARVEPAHDGECARAYPMKRAINPGSIRAPFAQYSHAVEVPASRMLFASGQLGVSPDDQVPEDAEAQAVLCFENIKAILAEAGMSFAEVVRFTAYVTDRTYFPVYGAVRSRYVSGNAFASTLVIVSGFTRPEFKVEVEVTAVRAD
jgi:enamine deaminase RidA (YjgF/YER057c/UK114 family)